ncbi:MAG TPA: DinB family protein [Pyrinomonadaceae bacterium]|nr:DinB family protein [Pyrinomonadaceae bacterium]
MRPPQENEAASYYFPYINLAHTDDIVSFLNEQLKETMPFLESISEEQSLHSYAPGKWTIRQLLSHVNDGERIFLNRALWFARGFEDPLPSFDQEVAVAGANANEVPWAQLVEEFRTVRLATLSFFLNLPADAWSRTGIASDNPFTVNALAYIIAGHVAHHMNVLKERYL